MSKLREQFCKENNIVLSDLQPYNPIFKFYIYWLENKLEKQLTLTDVSSCFCEAFVPIEKNSSYCIKCEQHKIDHS